MSLLTYLVFSVLYLSAQSTDVNKLEKIDNGVMLLPMGEVYTQVGQWSVIITLDVPILNTSLVEEINSVVQQITKAYRQVNVSNPFVRILKEIKTSMRLGEAPGEMTRIRNRRNILHVVSSVFFYCFWFRNC